MPEEPTLAESETRALVTNGYDAIAEAYTDLAAAVDESHPRRSETAALLARLAPSSRVLELGCGGGVPVAAAIVDAGHSYVGVDISARQVEVARQRVSGGRFVVGDVADQDFERESFGAVLMLYAITHVRRERWPELFARMQRWLRADGWLLINVPRRESAGWLEEDFLGLGATNWTNSYDPAVTLQLLEAAGFVIETAEVRGEDELDPEGWLWVLACKSRALAKEEGRA